MRFSRHRSRPRIISDSTLLRDAAPARPDPNPKTTPEEVPRVASGHLSPFNAAPQSGQRLQRGALLRRLEGNMWNDFVGLSR